MVIPLRGSGASVSGVIAIGIQQRDVHRNLDLEHVEDWSCHHYLQIYVKGLLPNFRISQHDQKNRHAFAVHHEKKILVHFAFSVNLLTQLVCYHVNQIVEENVQNCHEVEQY